MLLHRRILTFFFYLAARIAAFNERCVDCRKTGSRKFRWMYNPCTMLRLLARCFCFLAICSAPGWSGPLCLTGTLSSYEALGSGGCQIGDLTVVNFTYTFLSGTVTIPDTSITVTPSTGSGMVGLTFSSPDFNLSGSNSAQYLLGYTWDPGDIRSLDDVLNANSPVSPGFAQVSTLDCENAAFSGSSCTTSTDTVVVSDNGITLNSPNSVTFSPSLGTLGIRNTIELDGNGASSEFTSFENQLTTPEPSFAAPCLLLAVLMLGRLRLKPAKRI
jgi:hypothetical protein